MRRHSCVGVCTDARMMVIEKDDFYRKIDVNGSGISLDHPGHCGYEFEPDEPARWEYLKRILFPINKL